MYLMQTVSTTSRARPSQGTEQSVAATMDKPSEVPTLQHVRTSGGEDWSDGCRSPLSPGPGFIYPPVLRTREKETTEKKKKWSLGGLFRRRKKDVGSESSSQEEEEDQAPRKGFLARRRSRREKRKPRTNRSVGTFDHVVVNPLTQTLKPPVRSDIVSALDEVNGCARDANANTVVRVKDSQQVDDARRSRSREPRQSGSVDRLSSRSSRDSYQRHSRQDSSLSRNSSGGSESLDQGSGSRRGRRGAVKARAEALRDRQRPGSSSEEGEISASSPMSRFKSDDTLSVCLQRDGSLSRRSRGARTERYIKRLSRDEEGILKKEATEIEFQRQQRLCKSDAEGSFKSPMNRNKSVPSGNRWTATVYQESSDLEHPKSLMRASSATPSPGHSPLVRPKNILHYTNSAPLCPQLVYDGTTSTFPPTHSIHYATPVTTNSLDRKTPQHGTRVRGPSPLLPSNRSSESIPTVGIPRARINDYRQNKQSFDCVMSGRNDREYGEFQQPGQRSLSYDSNIHRVMPNYGANSSGPSPVPDSNDVMVVQFPVARLPPSFQPSRSGNISSGFVAVKPGPPPPPPPRDPQRRLLCPPSGQQDATRPMSFAGDGNSHRFQHQQEYQQSELGTTGLPIFAIPQMIHQGGLDPSISDIPWTSNSQRRSNSDNQLATLRFGQPGHVLRPHAYNPIGRPRQSSESINPLPHPQHYSGTKFLIRTTPSPDVYCPSSKQSYALGQPQNLQYFADQHPRSRRPLHIQYNATNTSSSDQPYLSDSQVVLMKPPHQHQDKRHPMQHATEFWRQKDQEGLAKQRKSVASSPRLPVHHTSRNERSRSNSPRPKELPTGLASNSDSTFRVAKTTKIRVPPLSMPTVRPADPLSSLSGNSDMSSPKQMSSSSKFSPDIPMHDSYESPNGADSPRKENPGNHRPLSMVLEKSETPDQPHQPEPIQEVPCHTAVESEQVGTSAVKTAPPVPPARRYSRQSSASSIEAADWMSEDTASEEGRKKKRRSSNLEDALTELEAIYKSLKLGDEDLLDRAERRDLPIPHQKLCETAHNPLSSLWVTSRGAESDSGYNISWGSSSFESLFDSGDPPPRKRAPSLRRSGIPDRVMDDMAYRRLHPKDRPGSQDIRSVVSQSGSYLTASPAVAAAEISPEDIPQKPLFASTNQEPDVTLDDVVFRNIRHANNTLKVLDPQPPFGIPLGPVTPAPNSDYLHVIPTDSYRPMFKPRRVPDVVKDDLAFRNLRKDSQKEPSLNFPSASEDVGGGLNKKFIPIINTKNENFSMRKRRAVRSLSANIQSLVNRESLTLSSRDIDQDFEKAQSLSDLPDALQVAQKILEGKEVIGGGSIKLRNLTTGSSNERPVDRGSDTVATNQESRRHCVSPGSSSWVERANLADCGDRSSFFVSTSTETLTDSRANLLQQDPGSNKRSSWQQRLRVFIPSNTVSDNNDDTDVQVDGTVVQRPPPPPTPERISSRLLSESNKTDSHQKPPPTPERGSSRRPSLDQNKLLVSLSQIQQSVTPDRESPRQPLDNGRSHMSRQTPQAAGDEPVTSAQDKRSTRKSLDLRSGRSSPPDSSLPIPEAVPGSPIDERQLEELLTALAREAKATSEKLERELEELEEESLQGSHTSQLEQHKHQFNKEQREESDKVQRQKPKIQEESKSQKEDTGDRTMELREDVELDENQQPQESEGGSLELSKEQEATLKCDQETASKEKSISDDKIVSSLHAQNENLITLAEPVTSKPLTEDPNTVKHDLQIEEAPSEDRLEQKSSSNMTENSEETAVVIEIPDVSPQILDTHSEPITELHHGDSDSSNENVAARNEEHDSSNKIISQCEDDSDISHKTEALDSVSPSLSDDDKSKTDENVSESKEENNDVQEHLDSEITVQVPEEYCVSVTTESVETECVDVTSFEESMDAVVDKECSSVVKDCDNPEDGQVSKSCTEGEELGATASPSAAAGSSGRSGSGSASGVPGDCIRIGSGRRVVGPCDHHRRTASRGQLTTMQSDRRASSASKAPTLDDSIPTSGSSDGDSQRHRAERVARYKEERRRQLESRYGCRDDCGGACTTPPRRYITRNTSTTPVKNGEDRCGSGSSSNSEQTSSPSVQRVRTTRTSRLRAAVTSPTESNAQSGKDASGIPIRNGKDALLSTSRGSVSKDSKDFVHPLTRSLSGKDLIKDSSGLSPRKDTSLLLARSHSGKDLVRDSRDASGLTLSRSQSGKELIRDFSLSPRSHSSKNSVVQVLSRSQNNKDLFTTPRQQSTRELVKDVSGSSSRSASGKDLKDGGSPSRLLLSSSRIRRVGVADRRVLTPSTGTTGSSDKEKSPAAAVCSSDGVPACSSSASSSQRREKDKSSKRKSNLNRSLAAEEVVCNDSDLLGEENNAIRRRRRRVDQPYGVGVISLQQKSSLDSGLVSQSSISPAHSSRSEELSRQSSPFKASGKVAPADSGSLFLRPTPSPANSSSRSSGDEHRQSPPSRVILRLTADSGTHFLQARRGASPGVATNKEQSSLRFQARKSPLPPFPSPGTNKSAEKEGTLPSSKLKACAALSVYNGAQVEARSDSVSQKVDKLMALTIETVARLDKLTSFSPASPKTRNGADTSYTPQTPRETRTKPESSLGDCASANVTVHKTVSKSDICDTDFPVNNACSPSPEIEAFSQLNELHSPIANVNSSMSSDSSPLENDSGESCTRPWTGSPSKQPSSILKKKSIDELISSNVPQQMPVSILKRKTSQDEAGSVSGGTSTPAPPVTFSPSVLEQTGSGGKRQGILKKRSSLDESEVLRRRSCSPDMARWDTGLSSEFRPILKNQRRSSMEELVRRTQSPDPQPQSILKRKPSREDEVEERTSGSPEPQGILKRKSAASSSSSSSSTSPHVSISASVIMNVAGLEPGSDMSPLDGSADQVRPILKKKSSSEDNTTADSSSTEAPKPILKKKTSLEVDDLEDRPMKPILKSSRKSSQEEQTSWETASMDSPVRCLIMRSRSAGGSDSASGSDCEVVRPILKQAGNDRDRSASPRHRLSFCDSQEHPGINKGERRDSLGSGGGSGIGSDESRHGSPSREGVILRRRLKQSSSSPIDNELSVILNKRRPFETSVETEPGKVRRSPIVMETARGQPRPMSVAERILNMESFLGQEAGVAKQTGAVPKRPGSLRASRDRERFYTQPITLHEINASARLESVRAFQKGILDKKPSLDSCTGQRSPLTPSATDVPAAALPVEIPKRESQSSPEVNRERHPPWADHIRDDPGDCVIITSPPHSPKTDLRTKGSPQKSVSPPNSTMNNDVGCRRDEDSKETRGADESDGLLQLCKSNSVVARASMFAQLEEDMKKAAEEAKARKLPKGSNRGVARYKARREELSQSGSRFATQPVTMGEVQEAVRSANSRDADPTLAASEGKQKSGDDDEPSQMSLADRVRLFNQKIQDDIKAPALAKQPPPTRKRLTQGARFKTQPVTTEEVETAAQRISPLAASLAKPPDPKTLGGMSARAARDKMYEHASAILAKSSSSSRLFREKDLSVDSAALKSTEVEPDVKPKGILKNIRDTESRTRSPSLTEAAASSDVENESESEVRGILKTSGTPIASGTGTPELESFRHLKSVLKKETASGVCENQASEDPVVSATNEQLRSILKPESTEWDDSSSSSNSDSSSDSDTPGRPHSAPARNTLDLVSILHGVEANARKQRQALISSPNNKPPHPSSNDENLMNLRNLQNEKENHQGGMDTTHPEKKRVDDSYSPLRKDSKLGTENHFAKKQADLHLDHKSLVNQRKLESKLLVEELSRKGFDGHHVQIGEKNHTFSTSKVVESRIIDHKSLLNQKKLESKRLVDEMISSRKKIAEHSQLKKTQVTAEEEEAARYERQLHRQIEELQHLSSSPNDTTTPPTSDGETSSSGGREVRRIIRNEAVARRRQAALAKQQREANSNRSELPNQQQLLLKKSQSHSAVSSVVSSGNGNQQQQEACSRFLHPSTAASRSCAGAGEDEGFVRGGIRRSFTQPLTEQELRDADEKEVMSGASIAERLAALQKSGHTDWRKRISKRNPEDDLTIICSTTQINHHHVNHETQITAEDEQVLRITEESSPPGSGSILADRLGKLDAATQGWKKRVGPTDAVQFSVAGRMMMEHTRSSVLTSYAAGDIALTPTVPSSPPPQLLGQTSADRKRRTPRAERFRSKAALRKEVSSTPSSPQKETLIQFKRSISAPGGEDESDFLADRDDSQCGPRVAVPQLDDETFTSFFNSNISVSSKSLSSERLDICVEDLDQVVSHSRKLFLQKRTVRVQRKAMSSRNPIKALAARTDLQDEYVEVRSGVAEKELKRLKVEKLAKNSPLAVEALAGLASKEDFTCIALKKAASPSNGNMLPYKDLMLLQVKGRRHVQTRLVEPSACSINSGDNYVLVTPTEVYNYVGRYSNVIERSRGAEVAMNIQQKKDLGCSNSRQVITVTEEKVTCSSSQVENFWKLLGGSSQDSGENHSAGAGHPDEDELFESAIIATNMVYEVQDDELVPVTEYWGTIPKIEMLDPSKILVFDFGSELYVWNGKNAPLDRRRVAVGLVRELWNEGYNYSECDVCPLTAASILGTRDEPKVNSEGPSRPTWALLAKVTQHMETVLFREKFLDWPDFSRVIRTKSGDDEEKQVDASIDVKPCDVELMLKPNTSEPDLELEGNHVGRGSHYYDPETHRHYEIRTLGVSVWHILEYEYTELPESSIGQFHSGDSYVVRWLYTITVTGRELSGQPSRHSMLGRDRCAYFCWQGKDASLNEQGAAALLTVELDRERGPQVRVVQNMEPPAFLALFKGHMAIHLGRREEEGDARQTDGPWRLYISRGELLQEGVLVEVPCSVRQLRSRASVVLLNTATGAIFVWHGAKTQPHSRKIAFAAAQQFKTDRPAEVGFETDVDIDILEILEGSESSKFFRALGGANRHLYVSLLENPKLFDKAPSLFHLSSLSGTFCCTEVLGPYRSSETVTSFPFLQSDLYSASQPALFLLHNSAGNEMWLWQGWWPDHQGEETEGSDARGSGAVRWQAERRAAMQTALDYWQSQHEDKDSPVAYLAWAGLEPLQFTNLFPIWTDRDDIAELNIRDGRKPGEVLKVEEELARLTRSTYPAAQLLQRPLPDGVDPTRLELYLDPQHFQELLGMSKEEFLDLPTWKQTKIKKEVGLF